MSLVGYWDAPEEIHMMLEATSICGDAAVIALLISGYYLTFIGECVALLPAE
jgi:hypothetical protein